MLRPIYDFLYLLTLLIFQIGDHFLWAHSGKLLPEYQVEQSLVCLLRLRQVYPLVQESFDSSDVLIWPLIVTLLRLRVAESPPHG